MAGDRVTRAGFIVIFIGITIAVSKLFNEIQPEPYMDEIFHVPQAQAYCSYNFSAWDNKITTLPALYITSLMLMHLRDFVLVGKYFNNDELCSTMFLRFVNILLMLGNMWLLYELSYAIHFENLQKSSPDKTEDANIKRGKKRKKIQEHQSRKETIQKAGVSILRRIENDLPLLSDGPFKFLSAMFNVIISHFNAVLTCAFPYICACVGFIVFVVKNNGIVVGDRSSHQACLNIPQMFYFLGFTMVMSFPTFLSPSAIKTALTKARKLATDPRKITIFLFIVIITAGSIHKLTYIHKYLLADNRHFTFYIWRRIYDRHWTVKYIAIPAYVYAACIMHCKLRTLRSDVWLIIYATAVCLVLIPQKLLELRYFIIPYLMFRLHVPIPSLPKLALEFLLYLFINVLSIGLFLYRPFYWENNPAEQRFMW
eukprot:gene5984-6680_t